MSQATQENSQMSVSAVIICKDESEVIEQTLKQLQAFDEVLIYDNGSTDGTQDIVRKFPNVKLVEGEFLGFGPTKAKAVSLAKHDWVFSLDADESPSEELCAAIKTWDFGDTKSVGLVLRQNSMMGKIFPYGGWGKDFLVRLFNRRQFNFNDAPVHESVDSKGAQEKKLKGSLYHEAVTDLGDMLKKIDRYSDLRMEHSEKILPFPIIVFKSAFAFFRSYILYRGFLGGWRGFVVAFAGSVGVFFKYAKPYARAKASSSPRGR